MVRSSQRIVTGANSFRCDFDTKGDPKGLDARPRCHHQVPGPPLLPILFDSCAKEVCVWLQSILALALALALAVALILNLDINLNLTLSLALILQGLLSAAIDPNPTLTLILTLTLIRSEWSNTPRTRQLH